MKVKLQVKNVPVTVLREGKRYVAYSPVFDISTSAPTHKLVKKRIVEAIEIFLEEVMRAGTLDKVLRELGWSKRNKAQGWQPPVVVSQEAERIAVPA